MLHNSYINNGNVFLIVLGAEMAKVKAKAESVFRKGSLSASKMVSFFFCFALSSHGRRENAVPFSLFYRVLPSFMRTF